VDAQCFPSSIRDSGLGIEGYIEVHLQSWVTSLLWWCQSSFLISSYHSLKHSRFIMFIPLPFVHASCSTGHCEFTPHSGITSEFFRPKTRNSFSPRRSTDNWKVGRRHSKSTRVSVRNKSNVRIRIARTTDSCSSLRKLWYRTPNKNFYLSETLDRRTKTGCILPVRPTWSNWDPVNLSEWSIKLQSKVCLD